MIQREVADRLTAAPGTPDYGAITPAVEYYAEAEKLLSVPAGCFFPVPKVDSTVIRLKIRKEPPVSPQDTELMFRLIRAAFAQRRKTLVNALASQFPQIPKETLAEAAVVCGFDERVRGERLSIYDFERLSDALYENMKKI